SEFLSVISVKKEELNNKDATIEKIYLDEKNMEMFFHILSYSEFTQEEKQLILKGARRLLSEFKVYIKYEVQLNDYKSEEDLIKNEILKYNPSSGAWIETININVNRENKSVQILV